MGNILKNNSQVLFFSTLIFEFILLLMTDFKGVIYYCTYFVTSLF